MDKATGGSGEKSSNAFGACAAKKTKKVQMNMKKSRIGISVSEAAKSSEPFFSRVVYRRLSVQIRSSVTYFI